MVKCRSKKCLERQRNAVNQIMVNTVPAQHRYDYEQVKEYAHPYITKKDWNEWKEGYPK